jgi:tetratricopeptide (TPR) repeat protein
VSSFLRFALFSSFAVTLAAQSSGEVVSVEELRNPLAVKSLRAIITAREHLKSGQHDPGMQELRDAMGDPAAMPYAISMLGAEHLKAGQVDTALGELEQAIPLLPRPEIRSNLAYALYLKGETERGLKEVRQALQLDGGRPKTRLVLGMLLLQQGNHEEEAIQQLQAAAAETPGAHLVLARHYDRAGKAPEAEKERRAYAILSMGVLAGK